MTSSSGTASSCRAGRSGCSAAARSARPTVDAQGRDVRQWPREIGVLSDMVNARDHRVFFGAYDPTAKPIGLVERIAWASPEARDQLVAGDFRDWDEIDAWASSIAEELTEA